MYLSKSSTLQDCPSGLGVASNTWARNLLKRFKTIIRRSADRYRATLAALMVLDPNGDWKGRLKPLHDRDLTGPNGFSPDDESSTGNMRGRRRLGEGAGEGRRILSWIWRNGRNQGTESSLEEYQTGDELDSCVS